MHRVLRLAATWATLLVATPATAMPVGAPPAWAASPGQQCRAAIAAAERSHGIPAHLLAAIARVESGRPTPDGRIDPWPFSINVEGIDHVYETLGEVVAAVRGFQSAGARSIDVGCLQVSLMFHPNAFGRLEDGFDPVRNATYAAGFLVQLFQQSGSWPAATAAYHSATSELGEPYAKKVLAVWPEEARGPDPGRAPAMAPTPPSGRPAVPMSLVGAAAPPHLLLLPSDGHGRSLADYRQHPVAAFVRR